MNSQPPPDLIIFDCDGVLVDSEVLAAEVFSRTLFYHGLRLSAGDCLAQFRGLTLSACLDKLKTEYQASLPADFLESLRQATHTAFAANLRPMNGIEQLLAELNRRSLPYCVASNGGLDKMRHSLDVTGLLPWVDGRCFSAEQVSAGKPEPDLFEFAAMQMGVETDKCWVVEDSLSGVRAGASAGMRVFHLEPFSSGGSGKNVTPLRSVTSLLDYL